jgi:peptide chain release factor subunit 1
MSSVIEQWKIKKIISNLKNAEGNGTSMISLAIPPRRGGGQISQVNKMLAEEYGTAMNIKSRVNRLSVLSAITSAQMKLKLYHRLPDNGLIIYVGTIGTEKGERKIAVDFEPFKPINRSIYHCGSKFRTEILDELLENDDVYGFIVVDGNGSYFGSLSGNSVVELASFIVNLPKKHNKGGQSAIRFARLREEKRHNYVRKVAEASIATFIVDNKVNVSGIILAGSAEFKEVLAKSDLFDSRLKEKIIKIVDIPYGGKKGFYHAIEESKDVLSNVRLVKEAKILSTYFGEIAKDTGKVCYGVDNTMHAFELGAVDTLIVWGNLSIHRINKNDIIEYEPEGDDDSLLLEWLVSNYKGRGAELEIISDCTEQGVQFVKGFGGIGGILRYKIDNEQLENNSEDDQESDLLDDDDEIFI